MNRYLKISLLFLIFIFAGVGPVWAREVVGRRIETLDSALWTKSEWISVVDAPIVTGKIVRGNERAADGASWFVSNVKNEKKVASARWMTTGLGVFQLFINGKPVGEETLKPGFTHNRKTRLSFTYDVTDAISLKKGADNFFAVQVTPGWWGDKIITPGRHEGMVGKKVAFRGVLELIYTEGSRQYFGTNITDWKAGIGGPVTHAAIYDGEEYDARIAPPFDGASFSVPEINTEYAGGIFPSEGAEVYFRPDLAFAPAVAYIWEGVTGKTDDEYGKVNITRRFDKGDEIMLRPGETLVVDFGQNCAGVPRFEFQAVRGTELVCLPAEILNDGNGAKSRGMDGPEGSVHRQNLRIPDIGIVLKYTFGDNDSYVSYAPESTFYGYRYISVTADNDVKIRSVESLPVSSITPGMEIGLLTTGNEMVNRLISNVMWGMRSNYLSVPTDCPQRDERMGWTADTQVFAETGTYFADTRSFFHKWMRDMRDTQSSEGGFPGVAPLAHAAAAPSEMARLGWSDAGVIVPWVVWKQFGDTAIVNENWASMEKYMKLIGDAKYDHTTLRAHNGNYQWADWLSYEPLESCSGRKDYIDANGKRHVRSEAIDYWNFLGASYWLIDSEMMRDMALATGRDASKYENMVAESREYIKDNFLDENGNFKTEILNTMQTPALFALKNGVVEGSAKDSMIARLRQNFADHGNCLQTGFLGTSILMPTLTDNGMTDIAYELLFQRNNPSWMYSIDNGATTIWERWNSYMRDTGMGPQGMNSFNHYAYGCVCEWMWESMAGIAAAPSAPGFKRIIMKPQPDKRLGYVDAEYRSAAGPIKSSWRYDGDDWTWTFTIPEGSVADVTIPGESSSQEFSAGTYTVNRKF